MQMKFQDTNINSSCLSGFYFYSGNSESKELITQVSVAKSDGDLAGTLQAVKKALK
jgi:hypothetical protein